MLILAAWPPELAQIRRWLRTAEGTVQQSVSVAAVGVGLVEAAVGTASALAKFQPDRVILVGTAGVFAAHAVALCDAVVVSKVSLGSPEASGVAEIPAPMTTVCELSRSLWRALARGTHLPPASVVCPLAITRSRQRAEALATSSGASLENLEAFAVVRAALRAKVPVAAVLGVANTVGPKGREQWRHNGVAAAAAACDVVAAWLSSAQAKRLLLKSR